MTAQVLIVDDDRAMCGMIAAGLRPSGLQVTTVTDPAQALVALDSTEYDCVVTDVRMGSSNGIDLCAEVVSRRPLVPVIVMTAFGSIRTAIEAIRAGAFEFLVKPFELDALRHLVSRAIENKRLRQRVSQLEQTVRELGAAPGLIGGSEPVKLLQQQIKRAAASDVNVLIQGESGSGKELVARQLHEQSPRRTGPFVAINCAALPETLMEAELFGHVKGAFTDARNSRSGLFARAHGGSVFLDEVGELPLSLQPKLLRVLQERTVRPLGGDTEVAFDARLIAATNRDLEQAVAAGKFREDLYYRLHVVRLDVPPLRVRGNDVLLLAQRFIELSCARGSRMPVSLARETSQRLLEYNWPGNVRELQNCIERAVTLSAHNTLEPDDLPERIRNYSAEPALQTDPSEFVALEEVERRHILSVFRAVGGNKSLASKILGLNRKTLYRKLRLYGVDVPDGNEADRE